MKCTNCGYETNEDIQFCPVCGEVIHMDVSVVASENAENSSIPTPQNTNEYTPATSRDANEYSPPNTNAYTPQSGNYAPNFSNNNVYGQQSVFTGDQKIKNYLTLNIVFLILNVITLCFCCIDGWVFILQILIVLGSLTVSIIGVVFSNKVNKMIKAGNIQAAMEASIKAKKLFYIGMILLIIKVIIFAVYLVVVISSAGGVDEMVKQIQEQYNQNMSSYQ